MSSWRYYNNLIVDLRVKLPSYDEKDPNFIAEIKQFLLNPWFYLKDIDFSNRKGTKYCIDAVFRSKDPKFGPLNYFFKRRNYHFKAYEFNNLRALKFFNYNNFENFASIRFSQ